MVSLNCPGCGNELDVIPSAATIACPQCGQKVANTQFTADGTRVLNTGAAPVAAGAPTSAISNGDAVHSDTLSPRPPGPTDPSRFRFLTPPADGQGLGELAHYRVTHLLGQGGMGTVFRAEDKQLNRPVALKVMNPDVAAEEEFRQRFCREAQAMASLRSDHVVTVYQVSDGSHPAFLVMELLTGESLDDWLEHGKQMSMAEVVRIGKEIALGLAAAHEAGLIHRDIKPANIFLEGPRRRVKVLDFGLARPVQPTQQLTQAGLILGTPEYMAPEQADGEQVDHRCDLFSLGCVLYRMVAGRPPFTGTSTMALLKAVALKDPKPAAEVNPEVPEELDELIRRLMAKNPAARPTSAREVADELAAIGEDPAVAATAQTVVTGARSAARLRARRIKHGAWTSVLALVGLLVSIGVIVLQNYSVSHRLPTGNEVKAVVLQPLVFGMTAVSTGQSKELGLDMEMGIKTYFQYVNDHGGVAGRKLELIALDDKYDPDTALANVTELHEQRKTFGFVGNVGTPTAAKTLPYALDNKLLFYGAFTGAKLLRDIPPARYVFNYRASYTEETATIVNYLVTVRKIKPDQIAVFAQADGYGDDGFHGVARVLRKLGRDEKDIVRVGYQRNTVDVQAAVAEVLKHKEVRAVVMVATYKAAANFIKDVKNARPDMIFTDVSFVGSNALVEELQEFGSKYLKGLLITQVVPHPESQATAVREYRERLKKYYPNRQPGFVSLEGYIDAAILVEGLKRVKGELTTETLVDALESIQALDLGIGVPITFGKSEHQGSHRVWATELDETGKFRELDLE